MRSLTTLVWKSEVYVHFCSQVHVMRLWLLSVTSVAKIKEKRRKESWDIHPQSSAFPVRLLRLWFAFTPRHHWPISTILPVNKDLEDFLFWALWLPFASPKRGQKTGNIPSNLNLPGTGDVPRWGLPTMHTPADPWDQVRLRGGKEANKFSHISLQLSLAANVFS